MQTNTSTLWKYRNVLTGAIFFSPSERPANPAERVIRAPALHAAKTAPPKTKTPSDTKPAFGEDHED